MEVTAEWGKIGRIHFFLFLSQSIKFPMLQFTCCGINGPDDWQPIFQNSTLPSGCCTGPTPEGKCIRTDKDHVNEVGCKSKLLDFLDRKSLIFGAVGLAVALIQVSGSYKNHFCCVRLPRAILFSDHWPWICLLSVQSLPQKLWIGLNPIFHPNSIKLNAIEHILKLHIIITCYCCKEDLMLIHSRITFYIREMLL